MRPSILLIVLLALASGCATTVQPGEAGLMYRAIKTPSLRPDVLSPARYRVWGFRSLIVYDITAQNKNEVVHVLTADSLQLPVTATVTYHIRKDKLLQLHTQIGHHYYDKVIGPAFITLVRSEFSHHLHNALAEESPEIERIVREKLSVIADEHYIEIDQVAIRHIDFDATVTAAISRKIATRQKAEQKSYEIQIAERDADIARTTAHGRADSIRIQAEGEAAGIVAKGRAQAEAQAAIGKTLTPSYLQYEAFNNGAASYFFVPTGKDQLPIIVDAKGAGRRPR